MIAAEQPQYTEREMQELQQAYEEALRQTRSDTQASHTTISSGMNDDNLIKWQLEVDSILERVEHMLRGDRPQVVNGNLIFVEPKDSKDKLLNEFGVGEMMRFLSLYLNRNTILSNYDEDTINWKVLDLGKELADLFFLKYEVMGLDSLEKRKIYPMLVRQIVDTVHSSYLRALNGGERESLRTARQTIQQENIVPRGYTPLPGGMSMPQKKSVWKPWTWGG